MNIKSILITMIILLSTNMLWSNDIDYRGTIISSDEKVLAQTSSDENRVYMHNKSVEPFLGISFDKNKGIFGLEEAMNTVLSEGKNIHLTIDLSLQTEINKIVDSYQTNLQAAEVMIAVMESSTGKLLTMTTSNRYDINHPSNSSISSAVPKFSAYPYEPGAVMMPIALALALENELVAPDTVFSTYNGKMEWGNGRFITDSQKHNTLSTTEMILNASNIGITQVAWLLSGYEFRTGLEKFGFAHRSGIELHRDKEGFIKSASKFEGKMQRAGTAFGYGMLATFTQLLKAYSAFNNEGVTVTPTLIASVRNSNVKELNTSLKKQNSVQAISIKTAVQIHTMLVENVKRGTGINAQYDGLEIGGQTGTAHIYREGKYRKEYHSSFYGFVNDSKGNRYNIGVMIIRPKADELFYASKSAIPVFREIVEILVKNEYLYLKEGK